jgi:hypothetical protein
MGELGDALNDRSSLSQELVEARLEQAPRWVHERRDRSWKARRHIGEPVTTLQNDRDVLRVCTMYELRLIAKPPYPRWLGIPPEDELRERAQAVRAIVQQFAAG